MTKKLDSVLKQAWLKALRSGDYQQGHGCLRSAANEYCCLGVLCDIVQELSGLGTWLTPGEAIPLAVDPNISSSYQFTNYGFIDGITDGFIDGITGVHSAGGYLPSFIADVVDLPQSIQTKLAQLNDTTHSFDEVIQWIEDNL